MKKKHFIFLILFLVLVIGMGTQASAKSTKVKTYKITYQLNKGKNNKRNPVKYQSRKAVKLYSPTRTGYTFKGWYSNKNFKTRVKMIPKGRKGNIKLYAKWAAKSYKISYQLNKGINSEKNPTKYQFNKSVKLYSPTRTGYTFKGWYSDKNFMTKVNEIPKGTQGNRKFYAKWAARSYKITYQLNGGTNNPSNVKTYTVEDTVVFYPPEKEGHVFKGWYTDSSFAEGITEINKGTVTGDVKVYALWEMEALNINGAGNNDMIWSWWCYPQAIFYEGGQKNLYWGFATSEGYCGVAAYDYFTNTTSKTILKKSASIDDHNALAVAMMTDGRIMCIYSGGHNANNEIHVRISNEPESIERFDTSVVLRSSGRTCYSQVLQYNGNYYLFYRVDNKNWAYRVSSNGIDWTDEVILVSATIQYYCKFMPTTEDGIVRICMYSNPDKSASGIRMGFFNLNTGKLYNADNQTELGTADVSYKEFQVIIGKPAGLTQRMLDVAITEPARPMILYAVFSMDETSRNSDYKLYDAGNVIDICQGGNPLWNPKYQLGASFIGTDRIVLAREESGYDFIERYHYIEGNIVFQESVYTEEIGTINIRNARPIVAVNGNAFLWHRGFYDPDSYKNFYTEAKLYFIESE